MSKKYKSRPGWFAVSICLAISVMGIGYYILTMRATYPDLKTLERISGKITHFKESRETKNKKVMRFKINQIKFSYVNYYPRYERVKNLIQQKPELTVWRYADEKNLKDVFSPFQVMMDGKVVVSYAELKKAKKRNALIGLGLGLVFLIIAMLIARLK